MSNTFQEVKKNFGFGCMRFPMENGEIKQDEVNKMFDKFLEEGFNYFDTAHGYLEGKSELAIREGLARRHSRDEFILTDKLTGSFFNKEEDIRPLFESQLEACGVEYFDFYLMHAQSKSMYEKFKKCKAYETAYKFKEEGRIKHFGISFHDKAEVLDMILEEHPEIEIVQIQFNYLDYEDKAVEARKVYEVCRKYNKPVIVMEPVKGGSLVNLPGEAREILDEVNRKQGTDNSYASFAIRFAAGHEGIRMVLSGMGSMEMVEDNISYMKEFSPLNDSELEAVKKVSEVFGKLNVIPCTGCRYCVDENHCPKEIQIPDVFACFNRKKMLGDDEWNMGYYYEIITESSGKASECIKCGKCEKVCPQHLEIRKFLKDVAEEFETEENN